MIEMGNKIILSIKNAIEALVARDENMAKTIMESDAKIELDSTPFLVYVLHF